VAATNPNLSLLKAEVLLARAKFSPGVIDGRDGQNLQSALRAFAAAHGLKGDGKLNDELWATLTADAAPVLRLYTLTEADVSGPWSPDVGEDFLKLSKLTSSGFTRPEEMLAERFHMDEDLLRSLNPGADFTRAGTAIQVVETAAAPISCRVTRIEVDKLTESVRAYDAGGKLLAFYPATVGSLERPSPVGEFTVKGVARHPIYVYDPSKLTWGPKASGRLTIPAGPNNPVGAVFIALSIPGYGIHGTPDPRMIGKTASHGCVRLTNWDAQELALAVRPGTVVEFDAPHS
jgi:lipoprotein-anchoring transpeptidase ErfK/SrfK